MKTSESIAALAAAMSKAQPQQAAGGYDDMDIPFAQHERWSVI
jgi:hypothetical protein